MQVKAIDHSQAARCMRRQKLHGPTATQLPLYSQRYLYTRSGSVMNPALAATTSVAQARRGRQPGYHGVCQHLCGDHGDCWRQSSVGAMTDYYHGHSVACRTHLDGKMCPSKRKRKERMSRCHVLASWKLNMCVNERAMELVQRGATTICP